MRHALRARALASLLAAVLALLAAAGPGRASLGQQSPSLAIDADSEGNEATSLDSIDACAEIAAGESHDVDIVIQDVTDLLAWEADLTYDQRVIKVEDSSVTYFMTENEGSSVQQVGGNEDSDGRLQIGAFDSADPPAPDSGSGVLARVTIQGVGVGVSEIGLPLSDLDGNGAPDRGPVLVNADADIIGDADGDTWFDTPVAPARIAVDASCGDEPGPQGNGDQENSDGDGIGALTVIVIVIGVSGAVGVGGLAAAIAVRRRRA